MKQFYWRALNPFQCNLTRQLVRELWKRSIVAGLFCWHPCQSWKEWNKTIKFWPVRTHWYSLHHSASIDGRSMVERLPSSSNLCRRGECFSIAFTNTRMVKACIFRGVSHPFSCQHRSTPIDIEWNFNPRCLGILSSNRNVFWKAIPLEI